MNKVTPTQQSNLYVVVAGCNNDHIAPRNNQRHKHAKVEYDKYARDGVYVAKGVYFAKGKYSDYAKDSVYSTKGEYRENAKEAKLAEEAQNEPLAKEGDNKPLAEDGNWAGYNDKPLATRAIDRIRHARQR